MTISNVCSEGPFFDRLVALGREAEGLAEDIAAVYAEAKEVKIALKPLRLAVKRALETDKKRRERVATEEAAEALLVRLGHLNGTPLGEAAKRLHDDIVSGRADMKVGDDPWMSEQIGQGAHAK